MTASPNSGSGCNFIAFYGYKGGAGRSMLAANVASCLSLANRRVLLLDWDLEAPGVGDFLSDQVNQIADRWRESEGVYELLEESAGLVDQELDRVIRARLSSCITIPFSSGKPLNYLGPGKFVDGSRYAASLMSSDWFRFLSVNAEPFAGSFRKVCQDLQYETVIIDTRTGLNVASLYVLRYIVNRAFLVSPLTHQALQGTRFVWDFLRSPKSTEKSYPRLERNLILTRRNQDWLPGLPKPIKQYLRAWEGFRDSDLLEFPQLANIDPQEHLFFHNEILKPLLFGPEESTSEDWSVSLFVKNFRDLCRLLGLEILPSLDLKDDMWQSSRLGNVSEAVSSGQNLVEALVASLKNLRPSEPQRPSAGIGGVLSLGDVSSTADSLIKHIESSSTGMFERSTLRLLLSQMLRAQSIRFDVLSAEQQRKLHLDSSEISIESQIEDGLTRAADELWREGLRLRDQEDKLHEALEKFEGAEYIAGHHPKQLALYRWERAYTLYQLDRWSASLEVLRNMVSVNILPDGVSTSDLRALQLLNANEALTSSDGLIGPAVKQFDEAADDLQKSPRKGRENEDRVQVAEYHLLRDQAQYGTATKVAPQTLAHLNLLLDLYEIQVRKAPDKPVLATRARTRALLARLGHARSEEIIQDLTYSYRVIESWFSTRSGHLPSGAVVDAMTFAVVSSHCGDLLSSLEGYIDSLQLMNSYADRPTWRIPAIGYVGILESSLGRPDLACKTWNSLKDEFSKSPELLQKPRVKEIADSIDWWVLVSKHEMGESEVAWTALNDPSPNWYVKEKDRYTIDSFRPRIALALDLFEFVEELASRWEDELRPALFLEIDLVRRIATSRFSAAQARFCLLQRDDIHGVHKLLDKIDKILILNRSSATGLGGRYALLQLEVEVFKMEVQASIGAVDRRSSRAISGLVYALNDLAKPMRDEANDRTRGWFYTDRIRIAVALAIVAAILARIGEEGTAREIVKSTSEELLDIGRNEPAELSWLKKQAETPRALLEIVTERCNGLPCPSSRCSVSKRYEKLTAMLFMSSASNS